MVAENPTDSVEEAKEKVEEALDNLETAVIVEKIDDATSIANSAANIALDVSNESRTAIENIKEELVEHEENDEWQRTQIHVLMIQMASLQEELLTLKRSPPIQPQPELSMETQTEIEAPAETITPESSTPETTTETSSEIKTEPHNESVVVEPVLQTILNPHRKIRLV